MFSSCSYTFSTSMDWPLFNTIISAEDNAGSSVKDIVAQKNPFMILNTFFNL